MTSIILVTSTSTSQTISWPSLPGTNQYIIEYKLNKKKGRNKGSSKFTRLQQRQKVTSTSIVNTQLVDPNGVGFIYRVRTIDSNKWTTHPESFYLLTKDEEQIQMDAPLATMSPTKLHSAIISWNDSGNNSDSSSTSYEIQMRESVGGSDWITIASSFNGTKVLKKRLVSKQGYQFRVRRVLPSSNNLNPFSSLSETIVLNTNVLNTNSNPYACAGCNAPFHGSIPERGGGTKLTAKPCCGKLVCVPCATNVNSTFRSNGLYSCSFCKTRVSRTPAEFCQLALPFADRGEGWAQHFLAEQCYKIDGVLLVNKKRGAELYRLAAIQNHPQAQNILGDICRVGEGVQKSLEEAEKWFRRASDQGLDAATLNLSCLIQQEQGRTQEANDLLRKLIKDSTSRNNFETRQAARLLLNTYLKSDLDLSKEDTDVLVKYYKPPAIDDWDVDALKNLVCIYNKLGYYGLRRFWDTKLSVIENNNSAARQRLKKYDEQKWQCCAQCGKEDPQMRCDQCFAYCYCSKKCHKRHWKHNAIHRVDCQQVGELRKLVGTIL